MSCCCGSSDKSHGTHGTKKDAEDIGKRDKMIREVKPKKQGQKA